MMLKCASKDVYSLVVFATHPSVLAPTLPTPIQVGAGGVCTVKAMIPVSFRQHLSTALLFIMQC
jgi:hypothetical protein